MSQGKKKRETNKKTDSLLQRTKSWLPKGGRGVGEIGGEDLKTLTMMKK